MSSSPNPVSINTNPDDGVSISKQWQTISPGAVKPPSPLIRRRLNGHMVPQLRW